MARNTRLVTTTPTAAAPPATAIRLAEFELDAVGDDEDASTALDRTRPSEGYCWPGSRFRSRPTMRVSVPSIIDSNLSGCGSRYWISIY